MSETNETKKEMTMDDLARIVQEGFLNMDNKFSNRFDGVEKRLDKVESRLDRVEEKLDKVEVRLDGVENRLDNIEANLKKKVDKIEYNTLEYRVEKMEKKYA